MRLAFTTCFIITFLCSVPGTSRAQFTIFPSSNASALAQQLVGEGVIISNATLTNTGNIRAAGLFSKGNAVPLGIDSGILITTGRAATDFRNGFYGVNGNGTEPASANRADNDLDLLGDNSLAAELSLPPTELFDAVALEFDFVPLGDTIRFRYVMSSEEYFVGTVCIFNDAFGFFISGPGITGEKNIALIPGTNIPVAIKNVNNITAANCVSYPQYYVDKTSNLNFIHEGHTTVFEAVSKVIPCEKYHLKLVITDVGDNFWDSAVFIEAGSLSSNTITLANAAPLDPQGNAYLAEGCTPASFTVTRPRKETVAMQVAIAYRGTAINGTDVQLLPAMVTIPANEDKVIVPITALTDALAEGIETIQIFAMGGCANTIPTDSITIEIRDFDILPLSPDTIGICREASVRLSAPVGYDVYSWQPSNTLDNGGIRDPLATPVDPQTFYSAIANLGTCRYRDSVLVEWRELDATIYAGPDTTIAIGQALQLTAIQGSIPLNQITWSPPDFLSNPNSDSPVATPPQNIEYTVSAFSPGGCLVSDKVYVKVYKGPDIYVPTAFTPNGDGLNDILRAIPAGIKELKHFSIFNRWGQQVFTTNNAAYGWDGTVQGTRQPAGVYVWVADAVDYTGKKTTFKGTVTIIR